MIAPKQVEAYNSTMDEVERSAWVSMGIEATRTLLFSLPSPVILTANAEHRTTAQRGFNQTRNTSSDSDSDNEAEKSDNVSNQGSHGPRSAWDGIFNELEMEGSCCLDPSGS